MILKKNSSKSLTKLILSMVFVLCVACSMVCSAGVTASAAESSNAAVNNIKNSLVQVRMVYKTDSHDSGEPIKGGTGFLISNNTVLTCANVVDIDDQTKSECQSLYGSDYSVDNLSLEVVVSNDVTISATVEENSQDMDFAVLTLEKAMNVRTPAPLGDSDSVEQTDSVYALGFPEAVAAMQNKNTYTADDVTITNGQVSKVTSPNNVEYIQHDAVLSAGSSGGPLVNEDGQVVGINIGSNSSEDNYYMSVSINQIKDDILDELGIEYTESSSDATEAATEADATEAVGEEATTAPTAAEAVTSATEAGSESETTGSDTTKMIIIIAIAALAVIIVVIVILIIVNSKKKSDKITPVRTTQTPVRPGVQQGGSAPYGGSPYAGAPQPGTYRSAAPQGAAPTVPGEGAGETTVLGEGSDETSVLGYQPTGAVLVRVSTNEKININKPDFILGKERRRVDYCITGNGTVSRAHAKIIARAGKCYIIDLNSSNGTYVNNTKLNPNQETALNNGDKIKLSDEEFRFMG